MTFNHIVMQNILRDKWTYISYFLSSVFSILVFYLFTLTAFHPMLAEMDTNSTLGIAMLLASFIVYIFSFVFIAYSLYSFLKKKSKSIGVFIITGASMKQVRKMVFRENMLVGIAAIITALVVGLVIAPLFLMVAKQVLQAQNFSMYVPIVPSIVTVLLFLILFLVTSLFMTRFINKEEAVQLLKSEATPEKELKSTPVRMLLFTLLAIFLLSMFKWSEATVDALGILFYAALFLAALIALYLINKQAVIFFVRFFEKRSSYMKQTNMLFVSNIKAKGQSYTHIAYLLTILLLAVFLATSVLYSSLHGVKENTEQAYPYGFQYVSLEDNDEDLREEHLAFVEDTFAEEVIDFERYDFTLKIDQEQHIGFISQSDFNLLPFHEEQNLSEEEYLSVAGAQDVKPIGEAIYAHDFAENFTEVGKDERNMLVTGFMREYYVVPDDVFQEINEEVYGLTTFEFANWTEQADVIAKIEEEVGFDLDKYLTASKVSLYEAEMLNKGVMFFIGFMLSLIFLSAAMSILYFYLQTTFASEKEKYSSIRKIGLSIKEIHLVVTKELALMIFVPFFEAALILALILIGASTYVSTAFIQMTVIGVSIFLILFVVSFVVTRKRYVKMLVE